VSNQSYPPNPFAPPGPQTPPPSQNPQAWAPVEQTGYAAPQATFGAPRTFGPPPKSGNGLATAAIVMSGLALLGILALLAFIFLGPSAPGTYVLTGEVTVVDKGASHSDLQQALITAIENDGGSVDEIVCPERSQVGQGLVTVCHGSVDGFDWTGVVVFEDAEGSFIVTEY
jgi:hypothetical protein